MRYMTSDDVAARLRLYTPTEHTPMKNKTPKPTKQELVDHVESLVAKCEELTRERDEARRMVCGLDADLMEDQRDYARHRGWDCFDSAPSDIEPHEVRGDVAGPEGAD